MGISGISASFDVGLAKEYGTDAAILVNKIAFLQRHAARDDGFCWRTSDELMDELGLTEWRLRQATKELEKAGVLETKNTYIVGTMMKCKHYRLDLKTLGFPKSDSEDSSESDSEVFSESTNNPISNRRVVEERGCAPARRAKSHKSEAFRKPTVEEVRTYISEKGYTVDAEAFVAYYESNGWKVGRNPMKSWKHAVLTWERRDHPTTFKSDYDRPPDVVVGR